MIKEIIEREWEFFQKVQNIGGRASCQDDFDTFYLQRKSQFEVFSNELLQSYLLDLKEAKNQGRNMIMEKYAYMMESTDPTYFLQIQNQLPVIDSSQRELIDFICQIQVSMREEFNQKYPCLAYNARETHTYEDQKDETSFETYLRGELMTYSSQTLYLYGQMLVEKMKNNQNLIIEIMEKTVISYGYASLEEAEIKMKEKG